MAHLLEFVDKDFKITTLHALSNLHQKVNWMVKT